MGRKSNTRLKFLLLICGLTGLTVLPFAVSYSQATISNAASVRITDTANALIAVQLASQEVCFPGNIIRGSVINNMGVPLTRLKATNASLPPSILSVGAATSFSFSAPATSGLYDGEIQAEWPNGSAKITYSVDLDVINPDDLHVYWDKTMAEVIVTNGSHHALEVIVGNMSQILQSGDSAPFQRTGESTNVTFSLVGQRNYIGVFNLGEQRNYSVSIPTQLPPPPTAIAPEVAVPATPEVPSPEEPPADATGKLDVLKKQGATNGSADKPFDSDTKATELIIEP